MDNIKTQKGDFSFSQPSGRTDRERNSKAQALNLAKTVVQTNNQAKQNQEDALKNEIQRLSNLAQQTSFYSGMAKYKSDVDSKLKEIQMMQDMLMKNVDNTRSNSSMLPQFQAQPEMGLPNAMPNQGGLPPLPIGQPNNMGMPSQQGQDPMNGMVPPPQMQ